MNKTEKKLKTFLKSGVTCNKKAQKFLEKWFDDLKQEEKNEDLIKEALHDWTENIMDTSTELVEVVWEDARTLSGTSDFKDIQENGLLTARTIGYLVYEDEKRIAVCGFLFPDEKTSLQDPEQRTAFRDVHTIPKSWIKVVKILTTDWERTKKFRENNKEWLNTIAPRSNSPTASAEAEDLICVKEEFQK